MAGRVSASLAGMRWPLVVCQSEGPRRASAASRTAQVARLVVGPKSALSRVLAPAGARAAAGGAGGVGVGGRGGSVGIGGGVLMIGAAAGAGAGCACAAVFTPQPASARLLSS